MQRRSTARLLMVATTVLPTRERWLLFQVRHEALDKERERLPWEIE